MRALSGGERNRLLLARLFTRPANVLVLDEPTNDLDLETLELLEAQLVEWPGTLLLVSHDRVFLDHVVTSTLVFEGDGRIQEYVGRLRGLAPAAVWPPRPRTPAGGRRRRPAKARSVARPPVAVETPPARKKLSYNEQRELEQLPVAHRVARGRAARRSTRASPDPAFYKEGRETIEAVLARHRIVQQELHDCYGGGTRWTRAREGPAHAEKLRMAGLKSRPAPLSVGRTFRSAAGRRSCRAPDYCMPSRSANWAISLGNFSRPRCQ